MDWMGWKSHTRVYCKVKQYMYQTFLSLAAFINPCLLCVSWRIRYFSQYFDRPDWQCLLYEIFRLWAEYWIERIPRRSNIKWPSKLNSSPQYDIQRQRWSQRQRRRQRQRQWPSIKWPSALNSSPLTISWSTVLRWYGKIQFRGPEIDTASIQYLP